MFTLSPAHTDLLTFDVSYSYSHWPDILHIDPTLLLFLEDREIVYRIECVILWYVDVAFLVNCLPFVGFGLLDNAIMIIAVSDTSR